MNSSLPPQDPRLAGFPTELLRLLEEELAAGNAIAEIASCFPAPPAGAYVKLTKPVSTRARSSSEAIRFYDRNSPQYSGEFADLKRFHFILEPPRPPEPEADMDAIRAEREARYAAACQAPATPSSISSKLARSEETLPSPKRRFESDPSPLVKRFRESMTMDYEKWHDGIGYDVELIEKATEQERDAIESLLLSSAPRDWRDIEAIAALGTPRSRAALLTALGAKDNSLRLAVHRFAPELVSENRRVESLIEALRTAVVYEGLTQALLEVQSFHPPEVIEALMDGLLTRDGPTASSFAAMLLFLHGKADSPLAWNQRPLVLKFNTENMEARRAAESELRMAICRPK